MTTGVSKGAVASVPDVERPLRALVGPTAAGKTELSVELAERLGAEIVVVDSMTVYRGMDIGTAKPTREQRARIPHHLLDIAEPTEPFSVAAFQDLARRAVAGISARNKVPLLVGGSGLYLRAVADDLRFPGTDPATRSLLEAEGAAIGAERLHSRLAALDPRAASKIEPGNLRRTVRALEVTAITGKAFSEGASAWDRYAPEKLRAVGIAVDRETLRARAVARVHAMVEEGLLREVRGLIERGASSFLTASQAIGYLEFVQHLEGRITLEEAIERTARRTHELARRQMAWFRRDPRIRWFEDPTPADLEEHLR
ncbi:MAG TPA: tRNA (adenosine(37)-N6)-dimethylallyltransferase MiaA [Actinomycetota bacterium]|nr:tRNA (adenosine(37)-N6)-dimethylallyltransferase MiaA [Actinomycetota bacterium]